MKTQQSYSEHLWMLFTERELAYLRFMRWLYREGRLSEFLYVEPATVPVPVVAQSLIQSRARHVRR